MVQRKLMIGFIVVALVFIGSIGTLKYQTYSCLSSFQGSEDLYAPAFKVLIDHAIGNRADDDIMARENSVLPFTINRVEQRTYGLEQIHLIPERIAYFVFEVEGDLHAVSCSTTCQCSYAIENHSGALDRLEAERE